MTEITIRDYETDEEVGQVTDEGELYTDDEFLANIAKDMSEEGGIEVMTSGGGPRTEAYGDWRITPEDRGFVRAFVEYLPSPYTVKTDELRRLPQYKPPDEEIPKGKEEETAEKAAEAVLSVFEKEWVQDPSQDASTMRWRNTDTGEYRYQENKPAPSEGGGEDDASGGDGDAGGASGTGNELTVEPDEVVEGMEIDAPAFIHDVEVTNVDRDSGWVEIEDESGWTYEYSFDDTELHSEILSGDITEDPRGDEEEEESWSVIDGTPVRSIEPEQLSFGDIVMAHGEEFEVAEQGVFEAPDGSEQVALLMDDGNVFTTSVDQIEGRAMPTMDVGDYDVETEWGVKMANAIETGDFHEQGADGFMGVRDIQHHASDVDNTDVLADAAEMEMGERGSEHALRALKGRIRALGGEPEELIGSGTTEGALFGESEYDSWSETYGEPDTALESTILSNFSDVEPGVSADNMAVQEIEGIDKNAFVTGYTSDALDGGGAGMDEKYRDEIIVTGYFAREMGLDGSVVPVAHDEEDGKWTSVMEFGNGTEAEEVSNTPVEWKKEVDPDDLLDKFGGMAIAGASDLHTNNVMVSENGEIGFHDLDHATALVKRREDADVDKYKTADRAAGTVVDILSYKEYEDLPDGVRTRVDESEWKDTDEHRRKYNRDIENGVAEAITNRARRKAIELVRESDDPLEEYFYDPDEEYFNDQRSMNNTLRKNLKWAYKDATGDTVEEVING